MTVVLGWLNITYHSSEAERLLHLYSPSLLLLCQTYLNYMNIGFAATADFNEYCFISFRLSLEKV